MNKIIMCSFEVVQKVFLIQVYWREIAAFNSVSHLCHWVLRDLKIIKLILALAHPAGWLKCFTSFLLYINYIMEHQIPFSLQGDGVSVKKVFSIFFLFLKKGVFLSLRPQLVHSHFFSDLPKLNSGFTSFLNLLGTHAIMELECFCIFKFKIRNPLTVERY